MVINAALMATFSEAMDAATITTATFTVKDSNNNPVSGTVTYNGITRKGHEALCFVFVLSSTLLPTTHRD